MLTCCSPFRRPTPSGHRPRRPRVHRFTGGFTLIEMLVVIVIISLLAGMIFGMIKMVGINADRAKTRRTVELLASAVEEFRAEYGKYPPVTMVGGEQPVIYEFANEAFISPGTVGNIMGNRGRLFTFGLLSYLRPRVEGAASQSPREAIEDGEQWKAENEGVDDKARDLRAAKRFHPYIDPIIGRGGIPRSAGGISYTNEMFSVNDAWDRSLKYKSLPPYDSYRIWSTGPDRTDGTKDDIVSGTE